MNKTKSLMVFAALVGVLLVGSVMALPAITVTIQKAAIGENSIAPPFTAVDVNLIPGTAGDTLASVNLVAQTSLAAGDTIYIYAYDNSSTLLGQGSTTLAGSITSGQTIPMTFSPVVSLSQLYAIKVLAFGPSYT